METTNKNTTVISPVALAVITTLAPLKGCSFISIKGYKNKKGEVANHLLNVGIDFYGAKNKDIETLKAFDIEKNEIEFTQPKPLILEAITSLLNEYQNPNENRVNGQKDTYTHICTGVKVHNETGQIYIYAFRQHKTVIVEGTYKEVKSKPITLAKNEVKKKMLRTGKFTQFILSQITTLKANGETIEICE